MESNPDISVIVITYNQQDTLGQTLDGILSQECDYTYEILVCDDCSTDGTEDVCHRYAQKHPEVVRYMRNEQNLGIASNYFQALRQARGRYIADCAGDDFWSDPHKLQIQVRFLDQHPEVVLVHTNWNAYYPSTGITTLAFPQAATRIDPPGEGLISKILATKDKPYVHLCTAMYRRQAALQAMRETPLLYDDRLFGQRWEKIMGIATVDALPEPGSYPKSLRLPCEDLQLTVDLARSGAFAFLPHVTLNYHIGPDTATSGIEAKQFDFYSRVVGLIAEMSRLWHLPYELISRACRRRLSYLFTLAYITFDRPRLRQLRTLCRTYPAILRLPLRSRLFLPFTLYKPLWQMAADLKRHRNPKK